MGGEGRGQNREGYSIENEDGDEEHEMEVKHRTLARLSQDVLLRACH